VGWVFPDVPAGDRLGGRPSGPGLTLGLSGRAWVANGVTGIYLAVGVALAWLAIWTFNFPDFLDTLFTILWWLAGALALAKLLAAGWVFRIIRRQRALEARTLAGLLGAWLLAAACLVPLCYLLVPAERGLAHLSALGVVLALPLTRLVGAPAALAWNRHR